MNQKRSRKPILYSGIALLVLGILIRKMTGFPIAGLFMIIVGVAFKTYYILASIRSGEYKPGKEIWLLFIGLALFLTGLYLRKTGFVINPLYLIIAGLILKTLFIIRFIQLVRRGRSTV